MHPAPLAVAPGAVGGGRILAGVQWAMFRLRFGFLEHRAAAAFHGRVAHGQAEERAAAVLRPIPHDQQVACLADPRAAGPLGVGAPGHRAQLRPGRPRHRAGHRGKRSAKTCDTAAHHRDYRTAGGVFSSISEKLRQGNRI